MPLFPVWQERLYQLPSVDIPAPVTVELPRSPAFYAGRTTQVASATEANALVELASQRPLAWIGLATAYRHDRHGVWVEFKHVIHDPRSIRPLLLALALVEPDNNGGGTIYQFVVDLRQPEVLAAVQAVLRLPVPFVGHNTSETLFCLFQMGLTEPRMLWDTRIHEKAVSLGRRHKKYRLKARADDLDQARASEDAEAEDTFQFDLPATCRRHGVSYPVPGTEERLRQSFLNQPSHTPFSQEQIEYVVADAMAAATLYPIQVVQATQGGILQHLTTVEMPWVVTNARMTWRGVRVDAEKCRQVAEACQRHLADLQPRLVALGVPNVLSHQHLVKFFGHLGLLDCFRRDGQITFDKDLLAAFQDRHPAIPLIRALRRVWDLQGEKILTEQFVGADGRVHPEHRQLGTHSGRQTSKWPNVLGLGRVFRPLIVPEPGRGIGEVDLSQIEVGIAAAVYHDERLVEMFNTGDVYSAMAQDFHRDQLSEEDRHLPGHAFKKKYGALRNRMKTCTLGIIYGLTPHGLALYLDTSRSQAASLQERFLAMFPQLRQALREATAFGGQRGYASTVSGLRRHRGATNRPLSNWERNWMTNQPVQGSAAVVFKSAGNRLDRLYQSRDAWLILAVHDAYVFEAPLGTLDEVAALTGRVLCEAVQEAFPQLRPRVDVNIEHPECWNKDGHAGSVERWLEDPTYTF